MPDTITKIQVGDDPPKYMTLTEFISTVRLHLVKDWNRIAKGRYTVVVTNRGEVYKCFTTGVSRLRNGVFVATSSSRSEHRYEFNLVDTKEVYQ